MENSQVHTPGHTGLAQLRAAYHEIAVPDSPRYDPEKLQRAMAAARATPSLTAREREEIELIDAKIDMRAGSRELKEPLYKALKKLNEFPRNARTPEYLSEARGWLARIHHVLGEQTAAGKIYLDELSRSDSNLGTEILINSLRMTYGYDGGPELRTHLEEYFDTPEHAAFAIQLATNPHWGKNNARFGEEPEPFPAVPPPYAQIKTLLEQHGNLLRSENGANTLALLGMRAALSAGDPSGALRIGAKVPAQGATRSQPDFQWMLASAHFLSRHYAAAERPLLRLFRLPGVSDNQKAAAAYGLCGVYEKTGNALEQMRFAVWLHTEFHRRDRYISYPGIIADQSVYWAVSGWDLGLLLDAEAPIEAIRSYLVKYPRVPDVQLVKYSLAVRLARENRYTEAAQLYEAVSASRRAARMRQLARLYEDANRADGPVTELQQAKYKLAQNISANPNKLYFNDKLWSGFQRYALFSEKDGRLTRSERRRLMTVERELKDQQEERWRAYLILREVVRDSGKTNLGRRAAYSAIKCLRRISERFGRERDIREAEVELTAWLRQ
jgi:tellurite resistance protein